MKSIVNKNANEEIIERINKLLPTSKPEWGKMNVGQMFAHCTVGFKIAFGEIKPKSNFLFKIMGKFFKKKIFAQDNFKKNSPTAREFIITGNKNFFEEKSTLISYLRKCADNGNDVFSKVSHVFFGKLTAEEWDGLMFKHIDHHLKQFGV